MTKFFSIFFFIFIIMPCFSQYQLIPQPVNLKLENGYFQLSSSTKILNNGNSTQSSDYLAKQIKRQVGLNFNNNSKVGNEIVFNIIAKENFSSKNPEAYQLNIKKGKISINATSEKGLFLGIQTLLQLIFEHKKDFKIPDLQIVDEPQFSWRGMHLDVSRHFFSVDEVKQYLDYLALYKMNTFHWHLTDDQGWRIEIKRYPKLTSIGSMRKETIVGKNDSKTFDGKPYGGFYTQEQIKDVIKYAEKLNITIIPEIEMPGHALAALSAYPELACTPGPFEAATKWGVFDDVFCPKEETFTFLDNVLDEVIQLFPSQYIHIGGDECPKTRWKESKFCQDLIKEKNLKDEQGLQSYFIQRIEKYVNSKGRKIIGWDEILEGGLAPNAAVMSWKGTSGGIEAARSKHFAVMTPGEFCYFDHYQGNPDHEPLAIGGFLPLKKVYSYEPITTELSKEEMPYILGAQANLWTEYIPNFEQVQYMLFPRLMALSEVSWGTSDPEKYDAFETRVKKQFRLLNHLKINYAKTIYQKE